MDYTLEQRAESIIAECMKTDSANPYEIFQAIAKKNYVRIHGPEHHVLDGACILAAFHNAGGNIDLCDALQKLMYYIPLIKCDFSPHNAQCIGKRCPYSREI